MSMKQPQPKPVSAPQPYPAPQPPRAGGAMPMPMPAPVAVPQPPRHNAMPQPMPQTMAPQGMPAPQARPPMPGGNPAQHAGQPYAQPPMQQPHMPQQGGMPPYPSAPPQQQQQYAQPQLQPQGGYMPGPLGYENGPHSALSAPEAEGSREGGEKALPRISIHAFCERSETAGTIQATTRDWRMARTNLKIFMGGLPAAIEHYHNEGTPSLIIYESGMRGAELFAQLEMLASVCDADTKVVMVGAANDIKLYRELMEKGISDYLVPPFHPLTLIRSMSDLYTDPDKPFMGRVVAFFGAKGGVGSSTVAHNIAWGLASKLGQETSLVDLDSSWGTTGLDFNYDSTQGLEEALAEPERLDETLLDRIMVRHSDKLSILPAAANLGAPAPMDADAYEQLVNGIRGISPLAILDMPHIWTDWSSKLLTSADEIVITAAPDLANLRNAKNLIDFLKAARPNDPEPLLVLNKTGVPKTAEIPVKEFAAAVGIQPAVVLGYEPVAYTEASNDGKMLCDVKAAAAAFDGMMYLAHRLKTGQFPMAAQGKKGKKGKKGKAPKAAKAGKSGGSSSLIGKLLKRK